VEAMAMDLMIAEVMPEASNNIIIYIVILYK